MSSYVGKSFSKQTQDASSCRMHTFGNYGAHSEFHESNYAYEGLDLGGSFSSQIPSNSLKREAINTTDRARSSAAVQRTQSCSLGSRSFVGTHGYNPLSHGLLSQKAEGNMEVMEKPSGKSRTDDIKMETNSAIKQQTNLTQRQNQSQAQIYPWMTKLHMSHGKGTFKVCFRREENCTHLILVIASMFCRSIFFLLSFIGQTQEIIKLAAVNFMTKASIARKPVLLL
uniref:Uncharacterized protein n=1 Tax=Cyprinus carpio TaxID=7962 RepID=A0A8C2PVY8_CYPCA